MLSSRRRDRQVLNLPLNRVNSTARQPPLADGLAAARMAHI